MSNRTTARRLLNALPLAGLAVLGLPGTQAQALPAEPLVAAAYAVVPCDPAGATNRDAANATRLNGILQQDLRGAMTAYRTSCARAVVQAVRDRGMSHRAAVIAVTTVITETRLQNISEEVDHDSLGLFQQRASWGTRAQRLAPEWATNAFLDAMVRKFPNNSWAGRPIGDVAQAVQVSAHPDRYQVHAADADRVVDALWYAAPPNVPRFYLPGAAFGYGNPHDVPITGDWNGDGRDDIGVYRPESRTFYFHPTSGGTARSPFSLGNPWDEPIVGDWNGDGMVDVGVYRPENRTFYFHPTSGGTARQPITLGNPGDRPLTGDWNNDGRDDIGVYRPGNRTFYFHPTTGGTARQPITLGNPGDRPFTGDWNNDGRDDIGVYRPANRTFYFHPTTGGTAPAAVTLGNPGDSPLVGRWNGTATTPAVVR